MGGLTILDRRTASLRRHLSKDLKEVISTYILGDEHSRQGGTAGTASWSQDGSCSAEGPQGRQHDHSQQCD